MRISHSTCCAFVRHFDFLSKSRGPWRSLGSGVDVGAFLSRNILFFESSEFLFYISDGGGSRLASKVMA